MSFGVSGNNSYNYTVTTGSAQNARSAQTTENVQTTGSAQTTGSTQNTVTYEPTAYIPDWQKEIDKALWNDIHTSIGAVSSAHAASSAAVGGTSSTSSVSEITLTEVSMAVKTAAKQIANDAINHLYFNDNLDNFSTDSLSLPYGAVIDNISEGLNSVTVSYSCSYNGMSFNGQVSVKPQSL